MTLLKLTLITLLSTSIYAEKSVQIDMHGGKEIKTPSNMSKKPSNIFYGKILEIKGAMGYKYLKIDENGTELWIAIANAPVVVGDRIGYDKKTMMTNFVSKSLNQTFDAIYFASDVYLPRKVSRPKSMKDMLGLSAGSENRYKDPHTGIDKGISPVDDKETASKPFVKKDSYTVEEVHMWRESLKNQDIAMEVIVGKVSHAIMKLDWIHVSDGSGNEKKLTNDLVFTATSTSVKNGDKVLAKGKVIVDKDFGYGYFYKVIIQDATFEAIK